MPRTVVTMIAVLFTVGVAEASTVECGTDNDCKGDRVCYQGRCVDPSTASALEAEEVRSHQAGATDEGGSTAAVDKPAGETQSPTEPEKIVAPESTAIPAPSPEAQGPAPVEEKALGLDQAKLIVWLEDGYTDLKGVSVYVDGERVGEAPWEGIISPGEHRVRVKGAGYWSRTERTKVWPRKTRMVQIALRPEGQFDLGRFYIGLMYSFGVGSGFVNGEPQRFTDNGIGPGLNAGLRIPAGSVWLDVGAFVGPYSIRNASYELTMSDSEIEKRTRASGRGMPFGLEARLVVPFKSPFIAWTFSVLPKFYFRETEYVDGVRECSDLDGICYSYGSGKMRMAFSTAVRSGLSLFLGDWVEIRLDVLGVELVFEDALGVLYSPSIALALRI